MQTYRTFRADVGIICRNSAVVLLCAALSLPASLEASPTSATNPVVQFGSGTVSGLGTSHVTVNQTTPSLGINWTSLGTNAGDVLRFVQPSASSIALNRVVGSDPSQFLGSLVANGSVIVINPNGVFFGPGSQVNVNGLIASSLNIRDADFLNGRYAFQGTTANGMVQNQGQITTGPFGAYLLAPNVTNNGVIMSPGGHVALAAGTTAYLSNRADGRGFLVEVTAPVGEALNLNSLIADGGQVSMIGRLVTQSGLVQANSVRQQNGKIELVASERATLNAGSVTRAKGDDQTTSAGGTIQVISDKTVGRTSFDTDAIIDVSGGTRGGNAGFVELSGAQLVMGGSISGRTAPGYKGGTLLLDPTDLTVDTAYFQNILTPLVQQGMTNLTVQADNNLTVTANVNLTSGGGGTALGWTLPTGQTGTLQLSAGNNLIFTNSQIVNGLVSQTANAGTSSTPWNYSFQAGNNILLTASTIKTGGGGTLTLNAINGDINLSPSASAAPTILETFSGNMTLTAGGNLIAPSYYQAPNYRGIRLDGSGDLTITTGGSFLGGMVNNTLTAPGFVLSNGTATITINGGTLGDPTNYANFTIGSLLPNGQPAPVTVDVTAQNNVYLGSVQDRGLSEKMLGQAATPINTFNPNNSVSLLSRQGDIHLQPPTSDTLPPGLSALDVLRTIYPARFSASAPNGNVYIEQNLQFWPSPVGSIQLSAGQSIVGSAIPGVQTFLSLCGQTCGTQTYPASPVPAPVTLSAARGDISGLQFDFVSQYPKLVNISAGGNIQNVYGTFSVPKLGTDATGNAIVTDSTDNLVPAVTITATRNIDFSGVNALNPANTGFLFGGSGDAKVTAGGTLNLGTTQGLIFRDNPSQLTLNANQGGLLEVAVGGDIAMTQSRISTLNGASLFIHGLNAGAPVVGNTAIATSAPLGITTVNGQQVLAVRGDPVLGPDGAMPIPLNGRDQALIGSPVYVVGGRVVLDAGGLPIVVGAKDTAVGQTVLMVAGKPALGLDGKPIVVVDPTSSSSAVTAADLIHNTAVLDRPLVQLADGTIVLVINGKTVYSTPSGIGPIDGRPTINNGTVTLVVGGKQINVVEPVGGSVNVGTNLNTVVDQTGILTQRGGDIDLIAAGNVNVNLSRIATLGGGNITLTSTAGDINAGNGARTDVTQFPVTFRDSQGNLHTQYYKVPGSGIFTFSPLDGDLPNIPPFNPISPFEAQVIIHQFLGHDVSKLLPLVPAANEAWKNQYDQSTRQLFAGFKLGDISLTAAHDVIVPPAGIRGRNVTINAGHNLELQGGEIRGISTVNVGSQVVGSLTGFVGAFAVNLGGISGGTSSTTLGLGNITGNVGSVTTTPTVTASAATSSLTSSKASDDAKSSQPVGEPKSVSDQGGKKKGGSQLGTGSLRVRDRVKIKVETKPEQAM